MINVSNNCYVSNYFSAWILYLVQVFRDNFVDFCKLCSFITDMRAVIWRVRSAIISAPKLSPEVWCAPLGPSSPAASLGAENSQIQRLDLEKSPENHRRATHITEVGPMKRIPSANYSLSIALPGK